MNQRVILVTGGNGGLGQAIARAFLTETDQDFIWLGIHKRREGADRLVSEFSGRCEAIELDVIQPPSWQKAVGQILATQKRLDVLVNNAGQHADSLLATMPA